MKIALVSPYDYPYPGGVTEHIHYLDLHFRRWGHGVKILAPSTYDEDELQDNVIKVSGTIFPLPLSGSKARITLSPRIYHRVKRILQREQFDIVHAHEPMMPVLPLAVLRHSHAVNIGTFHAYRKSHAGYNYGKHLLQPFFDKLHGKIAVSPAAAELVCRYFPDTYRVIPNGIDIESFGGANVRPLPAYEDGRPTILFLGRLEKRKGFEYLLRAFPYVLARFPNARLVVAGAYSDEDKEPYARYVAEHRIPGVEFVGYIAPEQKPHYYASCDVFCAPSTGFESFGIVLLEAMAAGRPVVASDIEGYRTVLAHGRQGILVEPENECALAEGLVYLLNCPELCKQMGIEGQRTAADYSWERIAGHVLDYYREVIERVRKVIGPPWWAFSTGTDS